MWFPCRRFDCAFIPCINFPRAFENTRHNSHKFSTREIDNSSLCTSTSAFKLLYWSTMCMIATLYHFILLLSKTIQGNSSYLPINLSTRQNIRLERTFNSLKYITYLTISRFKKKIKYKTYFVHWIEILRGWPFYISLDNRTAIDNGNGQEQSAKCADYPHYVFFHLVDLYFSFLRK